jgi:L-threonylcarbamoyladenylate synthase
MPGCSNNGSAHQSRQIEEAARLLARGGLVVYPTETLYGLGADACNAAALCRLIDVKGREPGKPIAILISDLAMLDQLAAEVPPLAQALMRRFWPGPLTIVLRARDTVSPLLTGGGGIGVRLSSHPLATALVCALSHPVTAPSANPAGRPAPRLVEQARAYFGERVDYYLDAGPLPGEPASTVVDARAGLRMLRDGAIAAEDLRTTVRNEAAIW